MRGKSVNKRKIVCACRWRRGCCCCCCVFRYRSRPRLLRVKRFAFFFPLAPVSGRGTALVSDLAHRNLHNNGMKFNKNHCNNNIRDSRTHKERVMRILNGNIVEKRRRSSVFILSPFAVPRMETKGTERSRHRLNVTLSAVRRRQI